MATSIPDNEKTDAPRLAGHPAYSDRPDESVIVGPVADQAALHGVLAKIRDLGLPLLSLQTGER